MAGGTPVVVARGEAPDGLDAGTIRDLDPAPAGDGVVYSDGTGVYTVHLRTRRARLLRELSSAGPVAGTAHGILVAPWQLSSSPLLRVIDPATGRLLVRVAKRGSTIQAWTEPDGRRVVLDDSDEGRSGSGSSTVRPCTATRRPRASTRTT